MNNFKDNLITTRKLFNLKEEGFPENSLKFGSLSMESDKYITICQRNEFDNEVTLVNLLDKSKVYLTPLRIDAAITHPTLPIVAIRIDNTLQLYSLSNMSVIKSISLPEPVYFWRWISDNELGIVSTTTVYHWNVSDSSPPIKKFLRSFESSFENAQIINYQVSPNGLWCLLVGLIFIPGQNEPSGVLQMYSVKKDVSQNVRGRNGVFATIKPPGYSIPIQVICFEQKKSPEHPSQIFIVGRSNGDNDSQSNGNPSSFRTPPRNIPIFDGITYDFPITMLQSEYDDLVYLISRMGIFHIVDTHSGFTIFSKKIFDSHTLIFVSCLTKNDSLLCITRLVGDVYQIQIKHDEIFENALTNYDFHEFFPQYKQRSNQVKLRISQYESGPPSYEELPISSDMVMLDYSDSKPNNLNAQDNDYKNYNEEKRWEKNSFEKDYQEKKLSYDNKQLKLHIDSPDPLNSSKPSFSSLPRKLNSESSGVQYDFSVDSYDPLEHTCEVPPNGFSGFSDRQLQDMAFGEFTSPAVQYPSIPSLDKNNSVSSNYSINQQQDSYSRTNLQELQPDWNNWNSNSTNNNNNNNNNNNQNNNYNDNYNNSNNNTPNIQWEGWEGWENQSTTSNYTNNYSNNNFDTNTSTNTLCDPAALPTYMTSSKKLQEFSESSIIKTTSQSGNNNNNCEECGALFNQITTVLESFEKSQKELQDCKQQLEIYRGNMSLLKSFEDCDYFEHEIYQILFQIKERKIQFLKERETKEKELKLCLICQERERNIVFAPCGHLCICTECFLSNNITTCPMDRRGIESTVTVYF